MARAGETIENPLTGERITFLETAGDTGGESFKFEYTLPPCFTIPEHIHPKQEERHEIVSGTLRGRVAGRERDYAPGQKVVGPAGVPHAWRNPSDDENLLIISELRPALRFEPLMETYFAIARDWKKDKSSVPGHLTRLAIIMDESRGDFHPTGMPMAAWRASMMPFTALARVAGLLGYETRRGAIAPRPVRIEWSGVVSRPPEEVFEFVADIRNDPKWVWTLSEAHKTSEGPLGVGTTFLTVARLPGRRIETPETVVAYEPNRRLDTEGGVGSLWFTGSRVVEGVAGGSRITISVEVRLNGFLGVVGPILAPLAERQLKAEISSLKDVLEGRTPAANDRGKAAKFLAVGLAATIPFALLRRRNKNRRTS